MHKPLSEALAPQVHDLSRMRGLAYFRSGAVRSITSELGITHASVRGSRTYDVWIEPEGALLLASCTCPYFLDRFDICKHVWAVVLAADAQGLPLLPPNVSPAHATIEALSHNDEFEHGRPWSPPIVPSARTPPDAPRTPKAPPVWRQLLSSVAGGTSPAPAPRPGPPPGQLLYVIDIGSSVRSGALVVELMTRDRKLNGDWGKARIARVTLADVRSHSDLAERQLLERLVGARPHVEWSGWEGGYGSELSRLELRGVLVADITPLLCATGRCVLRVESAPGQVRPQVRLRPDPITAGPHQPTPTTTADISIEWDDGLPWVFGMTIRRGRDNDGPDNDEPSTSPATGSYTIEGWLARGDERMTLADPLLVLTDGVLFTPTHASRLDAGRAFPWLTALRNNGPIDVPAEARDELIDALLVSSPPLADVPDDLHIETVQGQPKPQLRLRPERGRGGRLRAELAFDYDGHVVPFKATPQIVRAVGSTRAIQRDGEAERRALDTLHQRGCRVEWSQEGGRALQLSAHLLPKIVRPLLDAGWHVEAQGQVYRQPGDASVRVSSGIDWFELHGHVEYDDQRAPLPALLAALARGDGFVTLGDGTIGLLPEQWLRKYATLAGLGSASGDHLRFKPSQVALLDALIAAQPDASWDDAFARARTDLQSFDGIRAVDPPATFAGTLREYQREGLGWLLFLQRFGFGGCLADDMGLGKTVMVLALLAARRAAQATSDARPSLVVAPRSVVFNWRQEAARFTPELRVLEYVGAGRTAMRETFANYDIVLTTYGTLRRDAAAITSVPFDYVVLDEAQAIKNASSVSAKATRVLNARHRLALSGTPIENHLGELWSLFEFLNPGLLSTATAFGRSGVSTRADDEAVTLLARGLRPFILRRTKEQVASDLPAKTEQTLYCELERPQRALYDELRAHYRHMLLEGTAGGGFGRAKIQVLEALLRLRQVACHPGLVDRRRSADSSAKLDVLVPRLIEAVEEGHKTLVFSQFTSLLAILRTRLDDRAVLYEYLDGRTRDRQSKVERFQTDPTCRLFLISLKAGGLGLNLTAAEYVFLLDPWWNPAVEAQAIDRAHRIGQSRHVFAYRLIARDTVEERVLELQQRKRKLADAILAADNGVMRDLRREDLELLLS